MGDPVSVSGHVVTSLSAILTLLRAPVAELARQAVHHRVTPLCEVAIAGSLIGLGRRLVTIGRRLIAYGRGLIGVRCRLVCIRPGLITNGERMIGSRRARRRVADVVRLVGAPLRCLDWGVA